MQRVIPHLNDTKTGYPIESVIEYSETDRKLSISFRYGGDCFDPLQDAESLSSRIVKGFAEKTDFSYTDANSLVIEI